MTGIGWKLTAWTLEAIKPAFSRTICGRTTSSTLRCTPDCESLLTQGPRPFDATQIFMMGIGAAYHGIIELLGNNGAVHDLTATGAETDTSSRKHNLGRERNHSLHRLHLHKLNSKHQTCHR